QRPRKGLRFLLRHRRGGGAAGRPGHRPDLGALGRPLGPRPERRLRHPRRRPPLLAGLLRPAKAPDPRPRLSPTPPPAAGEKQETRDRQPATGNRQPRATSSPVACCRSPVSCLLFLPPNTTPLARDRSEEPTCWAPSPRAPAPAGRGGSAGARA